jgi:hypothetical protein
MPWREAIVAVEPVKVVLKAEEVYDCDELAWWHLVGIERIESQVLSLARIRVMRTLRQDTRYFLYIPSNLPTIDSVWDQACHTDQEPCSERNIEI